MAEQDNTFNRPDNDDEFGLPEVSYEPIDRENANPPLEDEHRYYADEDADDNRKKILLTIVFLILFLGIIGTVVYFVAFHNKSAPPQEQLVSDIVSEPEPEPEPEPVEEVVEETPEVTFNTYNEVTTISSPTGRSYIIIGSFVDEDLARDFGEKLLQEQGVGTVIIEPFGKTSLLHRVAIADYANFQEAMMEVENHRTTYGPETWVLKY